MVRLATLRVALPKNKCSGATIRWARQHMRRACWSRASLWMSSLCIQNMVYPSARACARGARTLLASRAPSCADRRTPKAHVPRSASRGIKAACASLVMKLNKRRRWQRRWRRLWRRTKRRQREAAAMSCQLLRSSQRTGFGEPSSLMANVLAASGTTPDHWRVDSRGLFWGGGGVNNKAERQTLYEVTRVHPRISIAQPYSNGPRPEVMSRIKPVSFKERIESTMVRHEQPATTVSATGEVFTNTSTAQPVAVEEAIDLLRENGYSCTKNSQNNLNVLHDLHNSVTGM